MQYYIRITIFLFIYFCHISEGFAANNQPNLNKADISKIDKFDASKIEKQFIPLPKPLSEPKDVIGDVEVESKAPANAKDIKFILKKVIIEGNTLYSNDRLLSIYDAYLGKQITLHMAYEFAAQITELYKEDGYIFSKAIIPNQSIENGVVRIKIIEGYIGKVIIDNSYSPSSYVKKIIQDIQNAVPLSVKQLERYVLTLTDLGLSVRSIVKPMINAKSKKSGIALELVLIIEPQPNKGNILFNNYGSKSADRNLVGAEYTMNNFISAHSQTMLRILNSATLNRMSFLSLSHQIPLNAAGTKGAVSTNVVRSKPGGMLSAYRVRSDYAEASINLSHPLIRSRSNNLSLGTELTHKESSTIALSAKVYKNKNNIVSFYTKYDFADEFKGVNLLELKYFKSLSGSQSHSQAATSSVNSNKFDKITAQVVRLQSLGGNFSSFVAMSGQSTRYSLPSNEQFFYGGQNFGRGYELADIDGDRGIAGLIEVRYKDFFEPIKKTVEWYAFTDTGRVWNKIKADSLPNTGISVGLGIRGEWFNSMQYNLTFAKGLIHTNTFHEKANKIYFSLGKEF